MMIRWILVLLLACLLPSVYAECSLSEKSCPDCPGAKLRSASISDKATQFYPGGMLLTCEYDLLGGERGDQMTIRIKCFKNSADAKAVYEYDRVERKPGPPPFCKENCGLYGTGTKFCVAGMTGWGCGGGFFHQGAYTGNININLKGDVTREKVLEKIDSLAHCAVKFKEISPAEEMTGDGDDLAAAIKKDEAAPGSRGISYIEDNPAGAFWWNIKNFIRGMLGKDTPLPWVEEAIAKIGAEECEEKGYAQRKECYHARAIETGSYLVCEESYDPAKCYAAIASKKDDHEVCDKIREYLKWGRKKMVSDCYEWFSAKAENVDACEKIPYTQQKENCFLGAAINNKKADICDNLKYPDRCKVCVFSKTGDRSICESVKDEKTKKACEFRDTAEEYCRGFGRLFSEDNHLSYGSATSSRG